MRPGPGNRNRTRGRTSNHTPTITAPTPAVTGEPTGKANRFPTLTPAPWAERAACAGRVTSTATDWWFAPENERWTTPDGKTHQEHVTTRDDAEKARRICDTCPVKMQCLEWSLQNKELWGIYGGLDESQRRQMMGLKATQVVTECK